MLHFQGLEPVDFRGKQYEPKIDTAKRLRLQMAKPYGNDQDLEAAKNAVADCFDEPEAKEFIRTKLSADDIQVLAVYLSRGETGLNRLNDMTTGAVEKYIDRTLDGKALPKPGGE